jgi:hypothetical protein
MAFPDRPDPQSEPMVPKVLVRGIEISRSKALMGRLPGTGGRRNQGLDFGHVSLREQELQFDLRSCHHRFRPRSSKLVGFAME